MRILFIAKRQHTYGHYGYASSGLNHSAQFVVDMLVHAGLEAKLVEVVDNNSIDKEVFDYKPNIVVIEALWAVPDKFKVLARLHPHVKWIVRGHSELPFLANEGVAIDWLFDYLWHPNVYIAFNAPGIAEDFKSLVASIHRHKVLYLPNYYPLKWHREKNHSEHLNIGSFGAVRPMKNQLVQAVAAVRYADSIGKKLKFHINGTRCEQGGQQILKNLRGLFRNTRHTLVEHDWLKRQGFLHLAAKMDFALAVSMSETFCITAADAVSVGVPLICSAEIPWAAQNSIVPTTNVDAIVKKLHELGPFKRWILTLANKFNLCKYSRESRKIWLNTLPKVKHGK